MKPATVAPNAKRIQARYDPRSDWKQDPAGYVLIRLHNNHIEVGWCTSNNIIEVLISGTTAEDICAAFAQARLTHHPHHLMYIAREVAKAERALNKNLPYIQDKPLP